MEQIIQVFHILIAILQHGSRPAPESLKGGIFLYPATAQYPMGKLRLVYECNPFAFILDMAVGQATDGNRYILNLQPENLPQCTPFFAGSIGLMRSFSKSGEFLSIHFKE